MPWNWNARPRQSLSVGGGRGTVEDANSTAAWPNYEAAYLAKRLGRDDANRAEMNRYELGRDVTWNDDVARQVYLEKVASNYKVEADEALKKEFLDWLEGNHQDNQNPANYPVGQPGLMKRRALYYGNGKQPGEELDAWKPTWWGKKQLTHLDGVRPFLREMKERENNHELRMNALAEYGPQNIDQAWQYFKHWVKRRPVGPEETLYSDTAYEPPDRSGPRWMHPEPGVRPDSLRPVLPPGFNRAVNTAADAATGAMGGGTASGGAPSTQADPEKLPEYNEEAYQPYQPPPMPQDAMDALNAERARVEAAAAKAAAATATAAAMAAATAGLSDEDKAALGAQYPHTSASSTVREKKDKSGTALKVDDLDNMHQEGRRRRVNDRTVVFKKRTEDIERARFGGDTLEGRRGVSDPVITEAREAMTRFGQYQDPSLSRAEFSDLTGMWQGQPRARSASPSGRRGLDAQVDALADQLSSAFKPVAARNAFTVGRAPNNVAERDRARKSGERIAEDVPLKRDQMDTS